MTGRTRLEVSDHALVKWMERTGLADLGPVREAIAESLSVAAAAAAQLGGGDFLILADGMVYVVRGSVVVTVVPEDGRHHHARFLARKAEQVIEAEGETRL